MTLLWFSGHGSQAHYIGPQKRRFETEVPEASQRQLSSLERMVSNGGDWNGYSSLVLYRAGKPSSATTRYHLVDYTAQCPRQRPPGINQISSSRFPRNMVGSSFCYIETNKQTNKPGFERFASRSRARANPTQIEIRTGRDCQGLDPGLIDLRSTTRSLRT